MQTCWSHPYQGKFQGHMRVVHIGEDLHGLNGQGLRYEP